MTGKLYGTLGPACAAPRPRRAFPASCSSICRVLSCASARFSRR